MKHKRLIVLLFLMAFISIGIFSIYRVTYKQEINYVALGDSVAAGRNPYGVDDYGYTDYISDYLKKKNKLNSYVSYAVSGYTTVDVTNDINLNKTVKVNDSSIGIKKALRESDLVTISIGANDFLNDMRLASLPNIFNDRNAVISQIDDTIARVDELLELIKKYAKGTVIVVGYYNPLPNMTKYKDKIDEAVEYADREYEKLCNNNNILYVKVSDAIAKNKDCLPNPLDIHPNKTGYEVISNQVIDLINKKVLK